MNVPLSVVVATRDRPAQLDECLRALTGALRPGDELIVVDSASTSAEVRAVAERHPAVYVRCDQPGASLARNVGWRRAGGDLVAFVDDDVRVDAGWARALAGAAERHDDASFFTGRLTYPVMAEWQVAVFDEPDGFRIEPGMIEPFGHGANSAVRRPALVEVGGFDEALGAGGRFRAAEDLDLWDRLLRSGRTGWYEPEASAWHDQWRSRRDVVRLQVDYGFGMGVRAAKLLRTDVSRARRALPILFWSWGLAAIPRELRERRRFRACCHVVRVLAATVGCGRGMTVRITDGHLSPSRARLTRR